MCEAGTQGGTFWNMPDSRERVVCPKTSVGALPIFSSKLSSASIPRVKVLESLRRCAMEVVHQLGIAPYTSGISYSLSFR
jgi:hypothetical protein